MELKVRNVNEAFRTLVEVFTNDGYIPTTNNGANLRQADSRNGKVLMIDEPVTITYTHPRERVLFNSVRDANPFFHLYESLWMLAGRNDVAPLTYYASRMREFSDDGGTLNGAYGYRWRRKQIVDRYCDASPGDIPWTTVDQLNILVNHLKSNPTSRRAVLQMWNVEDDLLKVEASKDVCCNLSVMVSIRECSTCHNYRPTGLVGMLYPPACSCKVCNKTGQFLDMTVTNRSNDLIWGLLGANVVHFSFLQEYMAARIGVEVGKYHHFTNNLHAYVERPDWKPKEWLEADREIYYDPRAKMVPLISNPEVFEKELPSFVGAFNGEENPHECVPKWEEPFFEKVADPMLSAFRAHKMKGGTALAWTQRIEADDWRIAATQWIERRQERARSK